MGRLNLPLDQFEAIGHEPDVSRRRGERAGRRGKWFLPQYAQNRGGIQPADPVCSQQTLDGSPLQPGGLGRRCRRQRRGDRHRGRGRRL